jgi:hypothetical protein
VVVAALAELNDKGTARSARHKIIDMASNDRAPADCLFIENPRVNDKPHKTLLRRSHQSQEFLAL